MSPTNEPGLDYYEGPELKQDLLNALSAGGLDVSRIDPDALAALDEFHAMGRPATLSLADVAGVSEGMRVLDVGAGIGGPARALAHHFGAKVTALDATRRFCDVNRMLCERTGLADKVEVVHANALDMPFADGSFDLVWSQALWQNVTAKPRLGQEMARMLAPGGRLALFEIVAGSGGSIHLPVPWADTPAQSVLADSSEMRQALESAGLQAEQWTETGDVQNSIQKAITSHQDKLPGHTVGTMELLMPHLEERMSNLGRNIAEGRIELVEAIFSRPGD